MGVDGLTKFVKENGLYQVVYMRAVAKDFKSRNDGDPVLAVDGPTCAWYLYRNMDALHGGQYKQFRERCEEFVKRFCDIGIKLSFFFNGHSVQEKISTWLTGRKKKARQICDFFDELRAVHSMSMGSISCRFVPDAITPFASVLFKELGCEVRLSTTDSHNELAQFAARNKSCIGVLSDDSDFLIYNGIPCLFTFSDLEMGRMVTGWRIRPIDIASNLGIKVDDLPILASFVGNHIVRWKMLEEPHWKLRRLYGKKPKQQLAAELLKRSPPGDLRKMCEVVFGFKWKEGLELVQRSILSYTYKEGETATPGNISRWDTVLQHVTAKHTSCEISRNVLGVMKSHFMTFPDVLQDLSSNNKECPPTGLTARAMLARMYTVLLWDSGPGPFQVTECIPTGLDEVLQEIVEVEKSLPEELQHPGLLELWSGPEDRRWGIFTWMISPAEDLSALRDLSPQHLVVPAAALFYLHHEAQVLTMDEVKTFMMVAVSVKSFTSRQLSELNVQIPSDRGIYVVTLFSCTVLHVQDVAGASGLSFPRPADCLLDAYFDGKLFHHIYSKSQNTTDPRALMTWDKSQEETYNRLMNIIQTRTSG